MLSKEHFMVGFRLLSSISSTLPPTHEVTKKCISLSQQHLSLSEYFDVCFVHLFIVCFLKIRM